MGLTTYQQDDINNMCSRADDYKIGCQLTYLTTAGLYNDGTLSISAGTLTGASLTTVTLDNPIFTGGIEDFEIDSYPIGNSDYYISTAIATQSSTVIGFGAGGGFFILPTTKVASDTLVKISSVITAGDYLTIYNPSSSVTGHIMTSSGTTINAYFHSGTSWSHLQLEGWDWIEMVAISSVAWLVVSPESTAAFTTCKSAS